MADDHGVALARGEALGELRVQGLEVGAQVGGVAAVRRRALGVDLGQAVGDRVGEVGHQQRVLPEVRVDVAVVVTVALGVLLLRAVLVARVLLLERAQLHRLGGVHHDRVRDVVDGLVDGRLELVLEDHDLGLVEVRRLGDAQLEVVRLAAGLGEVGDLPVVARHPLRDPRQRVERGHRLAVGPHVRRTVRAAAPGQEEGRGSDEREERGSGWGATT